MGIYEEARKIDNYSFTKDDFIQGVEPYEAVYAYKGDKFRHKQEIEKMAAYAQSVGYRGFKGTYKDFCREKVAQSKTVYVANATEFTNQPIELSTGEWEATDMGITRKNSFGEEEVACPHPILPLKRAVNIDTNEEKLQLAYRKGVQWRSITVDKAILASASKVTDLSRFGIAVTSQNAKAFVQYISDMENLNYDLIPEIKSIGRLGYIDGEGFSPFVDGLSFDGDASFASLFNSVHSSGNEDVWLATAKEVRNMSTTAKILLAASFASPVLNVVNSLPFFVHLWGSDSGTGKTVALMVAASVWGNPDVGHYIKTFDSTVVGLEKTAAFLNHLPLCLDELQLSKDNKGRSSFDVYKLAQGVGRTRGNRAGGVDMTPTWKCCILTTGESPIVNDSAGAGAVNRVVDIECKSSNVVIKDGMRISGTVKANYGFAGRRFVERLYQDTETRERVSKRYQELFVELSQSGTTEKQAMAAAAIVIGDELACEWVFDGQENPITADEIKQFLADRASVSIGNRAYEYICDWISQNGHRLCQNSDQFDVYGAIKQDEGYAYIIRNIFKKSLSDAGFSVAPVVSYLKAEGLLKTRGRNMTRSIRINGVPTECYCVRLMVADEVDGEPREELPF